MDTIPRRPDSRNQKGIGTTPGIFRALTHTPPTSLQGVPQGGITAKDSKLSGRSIHNGNWLFAPRQNSKATPEMGVEAGVLPSACRSLRTWTNHDGRGSLLGIADFTGSYALPFKSHGPSTAFVVFNHEFGLFGRCRRLRRGGRGLYPFGWLLSGTTWGDQA